MGSVLVGSRAEIMRARRVRKLFGGALRQAGIVAAAALYAMEYHVERLQVDHDNARVFADEIRRIDGITLEPADVETNLVFFNVDPELGNAAQLSAKLRQRGVRINATAPQRLRGCTHLDVDREMVLRAAEAVAEAVAEGLVGTAGGEFGPYARG
jgi:threonine aldolase